MFDEDEHARTSSKKEGERKQRRNDSLSKILAEKNNIVHRTVSRGGGRLGRSRKSRSPREIVPSGSASVSANSVLGLFLDLSLSGYISQRVF